MCLPAPESERQVSMHTQTLRREREVSSEVVLIPDLPHQRERMTGPTAQSLSKIDEHVPTIGESSTAFCFSAWHVNGVTCPQAVLGEDACSCRAKNLIF
jgi:hypothetical protein